MASVRRFVSAAVVLAFTTLIRAEPPPPGAAPAPAPPAPPVPEWKQTFQKAYALGDDEVLKRLPPPHIPERLTYYRVDHAGQAQAIPEPPDSFVFHVGADGKFNNWGLSFHGGKVPLSHVLTFVLQMETYEFEGPKPLLDLDLLGDYVVRPKAPVEQKLAALTRVIKEGTGRLVTFEKRQVKRDVVVATGEFALQPLPGARNDRSVYLYVDPFKPNDGGGGGSGDLTAFLKTLGSRAKVTVIDETEGQKPGRFSWEHQQSSYLSREQPGPQKDQKLRALLDNVTKQTGLKFETARRKVPVWFVTEGPAAG